jgi:hypothetical protein
MARLGYTIFAGNLRGSLHENLRFRLGHYLINKLIQRRLFSKMPDGFGFETVVTFPERIIRQTDFDHREWRHRTTAMVWDKLQEYKF